MNVLSLFDGISCGHVALQRAGVVVDSYYAAEIEPNAIKVTQSNFPDTIQVGDITQLHVSRADNFDIVMGGSPCQSFSFMGSGKGFDGQSGLFWEYLRVLKEASPTYFLLENVRMKREYQDVISHELGVSPIAINSSLVSAQSRNRLYWTNIPVPSLPVNKNLRVRDILDTETPYEYWSEARIYKLLNNGYVRKDSYRVLTEDSIAPCLTVTAGRGGSDEPRIWHDNKIRVFTPLEWERLQTLPDNYTAVLNHNKRRRECIGNGWTVDVLAHIFSFIPKAGV